jgi:hypothetical protein
MWEYFTLLYQLFSYFFLQCILILCGKSLLNIGLVAVRRRNTVPADQFLLSFLNSSVRARFKRGKSYPQKFAFMLPENQFEHNLFLILAFNQIGMRTLPRSVSRQSH